jgi:hypothetical protein
MTSCESVKRKKASLHFGHDRSELETIVTIGNFEICGSFAYLLEAGPNKIFGLRVISMFGLAISEFIPFPIVDNW